MGKNKYWQGLEELQDDPGFEKKKKDEFSEELPILEVLNETVGNQPTKRRDFLKYMGFSLSAAALAASCEMPVRKAIPYIFKPEEVTPGVANYYASTFAEGGDYCSVLVKTREGRPIKIEGNKLSKVTNGGTSARVQASVLSLYDTNRLKAPVGADGENTWWDIDRAIIPQLRSVSNSGKKIVILSNTIMSPSTLALIEEFKEKYPGTEHVSYDPVSYSALLEAHEEAFGKRSLPQYHFDKADVVVSFGADFLGTWISPVEFANDYAKNRKLKTGETNPGMSRHWQFESNMSMTGANADMRVPLKPSKLAHALLALHNEVAAQTGGTAISGVKNEWAAEKVKKAANELLNSRGKSIVICGSNDKDLQMIVTSINSMLGNYGATMNIDRPANYRKGSDRDLLRLENDIKNNQVGALLMYDCNPAYDLPNAEEFSKSTKNVSLRISMHTSNNESVGLAQYQCPVHHYLESWGDAEPVSGHFTLTQPTIRNIFNTRQFQDSLYLWMQDSVDPKNYSLKGMMGTRPSTDTSATATGDTADVRTFSQPDPNFEASEQEMPKEYISHFYNYIKKHWEEELFGRQREFMRFQTFWDKALHDGVFVADDAASNGEGGSFAGNLSNAGSAIISNYGSAGKFELVAYESVAIGNGRYADNPWLQEMPDPITKGTWGNYVLMSIEDAKELGIMTYPGAEADIVTVEANGKKVDLPVIIQPGQSVGAIGIAVGYGRTVSGKGGLEIGKNVYPLLNYSDNNLQNTLLDVAVASTGEIEMVAQTQTHHVISTEDRLNERTVIKEGALGALEETIDNIAEKRQEFQHLNEQGLYPVHEQYSYGHHWGMAIDLNSCIGCGACTIACQAENNVPVVGKQEVMRVHEMHWLRIDRYYTGDDMENPDVVFQPMLCQHCDNAPCENVCPVAATNHSQDGINQMAYNRCIGTRYCANNCPYKVRRFNWYDYLEADSFPANTLDPMSEGSLGIDQFTDESELMVNDLTRLVLNPDVTVRGRGVMEKCTFCIQRIQDVKLEAKKEGRPLEDGEVVTACAQACPTHAIVFGDENKKGSIVNQELENGRTYYVIEEVNTRPGVGYQAKIRNRSAEEEQEIKKQGVENHA